MQAKTPFLQLQKTLETSLQLLSEVCRELDLCTIAVISLELVKAYNYCLLHWSYVQQQYLRQNWPLALRGVVTPASPHIGVWITKDSA
jgi:hypothetical protein